MMRVGLKAAIMARGLSQRQFARLVNSTDNRISSLIQGWAQPSPQERDRFAQLLNQPSDVLFGDDVDVRLECRSAR